MNNLGQRIRYSFASKDDLLSISQLHSVSWKQYYRGILSDEYLDYQIEEERLGIWKSRFASPNPNQIIIKAELDKKMCGFACHFLHYDKTYGHYLDNLHVLSEHQGLGIGKELIRLSAKHCLQFDNSPYYLWVFSANTKALDFYKRMRGQVIKEELFKAPDGNQVNALLIQWPDPNRLIL